MLRSSFAVAVLLLWGMVVATAPRRFAISGRINGLSGHDRALVVVEGQCRVEATSRLRGAWRVEGLSAGEYSVTPYHGRYSFSPPQRHVRVQDRDVIEINFDAVLRVPSRPGDSEKGWD